MQRKSPPFQSDFHARLPVHARRPRRSSRHRAEIEMTHPNSFGSRATLDVAGRRYTIYRLDSVRSLGGAPAERLPFSLKVLLENLLRNEDDAFVKRADIEALATWDVTGRLE